MTDTELDTSDTTDTTEVAVESSSSLNESVTESELQVSECLMTVTGYTVPSSGSVITTTPEYDVYPISDEYSFEDIVGVFLDKAGVDDYTLGEPYTGESDYSPIYYPDYSLVIDFNRLDAYYVPFDYELHTTRSFGLKKLDVTIIEYENSEWAEIGFVGDIQKNDSTEYDILNDDITNGYCFVNRSSVFRASYYLNDCVLIYQYYYANSTTEDYQVFLDICEELGLPTCDEITEEIMGAS